ncbi:MAG: ATP-binding protein [Anaerolineae bacterium]|nr:ATP-binding protein [Anaerolineae bacterium]
MTEPKMQFQIYLPGLLKVLAESLYSTKRVAIRELIQNAHDSCVRREVEAKSDYYRPRITITAYPETRTLSFQDNGSGLTAQEVADYLSTIGRSYTRQLGEDLQVLSPEQAQQLIGQFGLGFLSSFLIASEVTLTTRSMQEGSPTLRWYSTGDMHYEVTPVDGEDEAAEIGTRVDLTIKAEASFVFNEGVLREIVRQYADFLPIPIHVGYDRFPINTMSAPWEASEPDTATKDYIGRVFKVPNPLAVIPLTDQTIDLGHDSITIPMSGFLFIPPSSITSVREYGDLTVFIRKMFICEHHRDLLPSWARFVRGVIDGPFLQPTASREDIQRDDTFFQIQQALEIQLLAGLKQIAEQQPPVWRQIVRGHTDVIMGWAVRDNEFFDKIADIITLHTSRGPLNLPDYLALTDGTVYFVTREDGSLQEQVLGESYGVPVIDAKFFAVQPFIKKYADLRGIRAIVQLDGELEQFLNPVDADPFAAILEYYAARDIRVRIVHFKPSDMPAIMTYPKDAEFIRESRSALDRDEIPSPFAGLVSDYVNNLASQRGDLNGTLYVNASCDLVQQLATSRDQVAQQAALSLIYHIARLFSGRMLDAEQVIAAFRDSSAAITRLMQTDEAS